MLKTETQNKMIPQIIDREEIIWMRNKETRWMFF